MCEHEIQDPNNLTKNLLDNEFISVPNEIAVSQFLIQMMESMLKSYPTTFAEDETLLQKELRFNMRNIISFRQGLKRILLNVLNFSQQKLHDLERERMENNSEKNK